TEAEPEERHVGGRSLLDQRRLPPDERHRIVECREFGTERHDQVIFTRIRNAVVEIDAQDLDPSGPLRQPVADQAWRGGRFVLDDQRAQRGSITHGAATADRRASPSSATYPTVPAKRSTSSDLPASGLVNGGPDQARVPAEPS